MGEKVHELNCGDCHGAQGQGAAGAYPALAGNRAVTQAQAANPVLAVLGGDLRPPPRATHSPTVRRRTARC